MKVLIAVNEWTTLVNFNHELVQTLLDRGYEVLITAPFDERLTIYNDMGCTLIDTAMDRRGTNPTGDLKLLWRYLCILRKYRPDCVLTYTVKPNIYASLAARILKIPSINTVTGLGAMLTGSTLIKNIMMGLQKLAMNSSDCILFPSTFNRDYFFKYGIYGKKNRLVAGSGVNLARNSFEEYPQDSEVTVFLAVMRIMKDKGIFELIEAIRNIREKYPIEVHILGSYETGHNYYEQLQAWIADGLIVYHGQQQDVHSYMKRAHCLIHPSYHEGMSNVCQEMAATGRPILASKIPGCREIFDDGLSGIGFRVQDAKDLTRAMQEFIELDYDKKRLMGVAGRLKMEKEFDRDKVIQATIEEIDLATKG